MRHFISECPLYNLMCNSLFPSIGIQTTSSKHFPWNNIWLSQMLFLYSKTFRQHGKRNATILTSPPTTMWFMLALTSLINTTANLIINLPWFLQSVSCSLIVALPFANVLLISTTSLLQTRLHRAQLGWWSRTGWSNCRWKSSCEELATWGNEGHWGPGTLSINHCANISLIYPRWRNTGYPKLPPALVQHQHPHQLVWVLSCRHGRQFWWTPEDS